ncbi:MAG TPA: hypothetical protein VKD91_20035 [Pyrinomonadaceae bacterium]|nr:hypothetical protein [Pyrinomonadaceae bacterium]
MKRFCAIQQLLEYQLQSGFVTQAVSLRIRKLTVCFYRPTHQVSQSGEEQTPTMCGVSTTGCVFLLSFFAVFDWQRRLLAALAIGMKLAQLSVFVIRGGDSDDETTRCL